MNLNIKNTEVTKDVRRLSELAGISQTAAVSQAVRNELNRLSEQTKDSSKQEQSALILQRIRERLQGKDIPNHDELLYNESGLPK